MLLLRRALQTGLFLLLIVSSPAWAGEPSEPLITSGDVVTVTYPDKTQELIFPSDLERASGLEFERLVGNIISVTDPRYQGGSERTVRFLLFALEQRDAQGRRKISADKFLELVQKNRSQFYRDKKANHAEELEIAGRFAALDPVYRYLSCAATAKRNAPKGAIDKVGMYFSSVSDQKFILLTQELLKTSNYDNYLDTQQRNRLLTDDVESQARQAALACRQAYDTGRIEVSKNLSEPTLRFIARDAAKASGAK